MFLFVPAVFLRSSDISNQRHVWKPEAFLHTDLTPPGAIFHFLDFTFYFIFPITSFSIRVLLDVGTLLQLSLGLNFGMNLSLRVDWRLGSSWGQMDCKKMSEYLNALMAVALKAPWCSWRGQAAFDTPSSFQILFDIYDADLFLSALPEMNFFHPVIFFFHASAVH